MEFEATRTIQRAVDFESIDRENVEVHHLREYTGLSGQKYRIDISYEFMFAEIHHLVIIECRLYKSKIKRSHVSDFARIIDDLRASRGIIVTTVGFQRGAKTIARSSRVDLALLNPFKEALYVLHPLLVVRRKTIDSPTLEDCISYYSSMLLHSMEFSLGFLERPLLIFRRLCCFWCVFGTLHRINTRLYRLQGDSQSELDHVRRDIEESNPTWPSFRSRLWWRKSKKTEGPTNESSTTSE